MSQQPSHLVLILLNIITYYEFSQTTLTQHTLNLKYSFIYSTWGNLKLTYTYKTQTKWDYFIIMQDISSVKGYLSMLTVEETRKLILANVQFFRQAVALVTVISSSATIKIIRSVCQFFQMLRFMTYSNTYK